METGVQFSQLSGRDYSSLLIFILQAQSSLSLQEFHVGKKVPCVRKFYCSSLYMLLVGIRGYYRNVQSFSLAIMQGIFIHG